MGDSFVLSSGRPLLQDGCPVLRAEGVAFVLRGRALRAWRGGEAQWTAISSRIAVAWLQMNMWRSKAFFLHVVVCYAPTYRSPRAVKDVFFDQLQGVLRGFSASDKFVLLGDFNARVGTRLCDMDEWADVRGLAGFGECNHAGKELLSFFQYE